mmetsp:Transcript_35734/g.107741  ORF Transcript_35734/g.107741 Transcript_35734/m.107741 type:complete len:201 (+) Transcript_35734:368-970(+)
MSSRRRGTRRCSSSRSGTGQRGRSSERACWRGARRSHNSSRRVATGALARRPFAHGGARASLRPWRRCGKRRTRRRRRRRGCVRRRWKRSPPSTGRWQLRRRLRRLRPARRRRRRLPLRRRRSRQPEPSTRCCSRTPGTLASSPKLCPALPSLDRSARLGSGRAPPSLPSTPLCVSARPSPHPLPSPLLSPRMHGAPGGA